MHTKEKRGRKIRQSIQQFIVREISYKDTK